MFGGTFKPCSIHYCSCMAVWWTVYLRTHPETVLERIHLRGRKEELHVPLVRSLFEFPLFHHLLSVDFNNVAHCLDPNVLDADANQILIQSHPGALSKTAGLHALSGSETSPVTCPLTRCCCRQDIWLRIELEEAGFT